MFRSAFFFLSLFDDAFQFVAAHIFFISSCLSLFSWSAFSAVGRVDPWLAAETKPSLCYLNILEAAAASPGRCTSHVLPNTPHQTLKPTEVASNKQRPTSDSILLPVPLQQDMHANALFGAFLVHMFILEIPRQESMNETEKLHLSIPDLSVIAGFAPAASICSAAPLQPTRAAMCSGV